MSDPQTMLQDQLAEACREAAQANEALNEAHDTIADLRERLRVLDEDYETAVRELGRVAGRYICETNRADRAEARVRELEANIEQIKRHWQSGIGSLDNPWQHRMAELVGDTEGLDDWAEEGGRDAS